jgi:hypothetical protein
MFEFLIDNIFVVFDNKIWQNVWDKMKDFVKFVYILQENIPAKRKQPKK